MTNDPALEPPSSDANAIWHAIRAHQGRVDEVLPAGDSASIKGLYKELGELLENAVGTNIEETPVLSFPETGPVVAQAAAGMTGKILDAGCGPNPILSVLLGSDTRRAIVALDISVATVRLAVKRAEAAGVKLRGVVGDVEELPFLDGSFDGCVCEDTIEHLPDDRAGLEELARVLSAKSQLILATPNWRRLEVVHRRLRDALQRRRVPPKAYFAATSHLREYTWRQLSTLASDRYSIRGREVVGWNGGWKARLASALIRFWPLQEFSRMIVLSLEPKGEASIAEPR